ncbi:hypothetical protein KP509_37G026300 [Ceratopteris richardii]|uniref:Uncharacterized protein n=1 Tax=Ceratopteris richardii TaxID=49495 RepID=A0A8T2Q7B1_CERRI|nr:hypothetical protein KP509_37G026300 [Ceratopteris richardii]
MMSMSSIGSLILRDKGDSRFRHVLKDAGSINSVEYRGMPVPERRHPLSLDEVVVSEKIDDVQKLPIVEELEKKNRHNLQNFFDGVVDLRPLTSVLSPASEVFEADVHWDPKSLLKELACLEVKLNNESSGTVGTLDTSKESSSEEKHLI